jgi:hypothetical protein
LIFKIFLGGMPPDPPRGLGATRLRFIIFQLSVVSSLTLNPVLVSSKNVEGTKHMN